MLLFNIKYNFIMFNININMNHPAELDEKLVDEKDDKSFKQKEMPINRICKECKVDQPIDQFYKCSGKSKTVSYQRKCKTCIKPKQKVIRGFAALTPEQQAEFKLLYSDRKNSVKKIAETMKLEYGTAASWIRSGQLK
jgi:hypothetical protein